MSTLKYATAITIALATLSSCKKESTQTPTSTSSTTLIVYMAAENSLSQYASEDISEMIAGIKKASDNDRLAIYLDDRKLPRLYILDRSIQGNSLADLTPAYTYPEDFNSCDKDKMEATLHRIRTLAPANHYSLALWSHGSGWQEQAHANAANGANERSKASETANERNKTFGIDNERNTDSNKGKEMNIAELKEVLLNFGEKMDYILFDACFMQNFETVYELRETTRNIIGSAAEIPAPGAPYTTMIPAMMDTTKTAQDVVRAYYNGYANDNTYGVLLSSVDCAKLEAFANVTKSYVNKYRDTLLSMSYTKILDYFIYSSSNNSNPDYYDALGIMKAAMSDEDSEAWSQELYKVLNASVCTDRWFTIFPYQQYLYVDRTQYSGISMHIPLAKYDAHTPQFNKTYHETSWAKAVWNY